MNWRQVRDAKHYADEGRTAKSGNLAKREAFERLLRDAESGEFDIIVVVDDDRLTRADDLMERLGIYGRIKSAGVKIANSTTGVIVDMSESMGELNTLIKGWVSAEDNRKRRDNIMRGKIEAAERGRKPSGPTPFGFTYDKEEKEEPWGLHEVNAPIVRNMYERGLKFRSCRGLATDLIEDGVPTSRGGLWTGARVYAILVNAAYRGIYTVDKRRGLTVQVPRIVSDELWYGVQEAMKDRRTHPSPGERHNNLCQGISICALCGSRIAMGSSHAKRKFYLCQTKKDPGRIPNRCPNPSRRAVETDELVWETIKRVLSQEDLLRKALEYSNSGPGKSSTDWEGEIASAQKRLQRLDRIEAAILQRFRRGEFGAKAMDTELKGSARDRDKFRGELELAQQQRALVDGDHSMRESALASVEQLREFLDAQTKKEKQDLIRLIVRPKQGSYIYMGPEGIRIEGLLTVDATGTSASQVFGVD